MNLIKMDYSLSHYAFPGEIRAQSTQKDKHYSVFQGLNEMTVEQQALLIWILITELIFFLNQAY